MKQASTTPRRLTRRARAARATVATLSAGIGAAPGAALGAASIRDSRSAMAALAPSVQRSAAQLATFSNVWGPVVTGIGGWVGATAARACPATSYAWRWPEKVADAVAAGMGVVVDRVPFASEATLLLRLPGAMLPAGCEDAPLPGCPDPLGYQRSAVLSPFIYAAGAVGMSASLGALVGVVALTYAPRVVARLADPHWVDLNNAVANWAARKAAKAMGTAAAIFVEETSADAGAGADEEALTPTASDEQSVRSAAASHQDALVAVRRSSPDSSFSDSLSLHSDAEEHWSDALAVVPYAPRVTSGSVHQSRPVQPANERTPMLAQ